MKKFLFAFFSIIFFSFFLILVVFAQTSGQGNVNINAVVPALPPEEARYGGGGGMPSDITPPQIYDIEVNTQDLVLGTVRISWKTNELSISQINYGKSLSYEKTYIGNSFSLTHSILLEKLSVDTTYFFEIIAIDMAGNRTSSGTRSFKISSLQKVTPSEISEDKISLYKKIINILKLIILAIKKLILLKNY